MRNVLLWYLPQGALFVWGYWFASTNSEPGSSGFAVALFGLMLAAAYTGGVNLILNLLARLRRRAPLRRDDSQTRGDSLGLIGARRSLPEAAKKIDGVRIRK